MGLYSKHSIAGHHSGLGKRPPWPELDLLKFKNIRWSVFCAYNCFHQYSS